MSGEGVVNTWETVALSLVEAAGLSIRKPFIDTSKICLTFDGGGCQSQFVY